ncbi:MAG: FkbM family methyltransferase [Burkholderiales bacterium]
MLSYRITPAVYGSTASAVDGITSANVTIGPEQIRDGLIIVPSAACHSDGRSRFKLAVPRNATRDVSARLLMAYEQNYYGFEAPYRMFLEAHLEPGDVFIDVGAHWGTYSLDVATLALADLSILACEPVQANARMLRGMLKMNHVDAQVEVIPLAISDFEGEAAMAAGNSMTWHLAPPATRVPGDTTVRVTTIDTLLRARPALRGRRMFFKIDVEGAEWAALQGARETVAREQIAAIILEYHPGRGDLAQLHKAIAFLRQHGFQLMRFPHHHMGGALIDFAPDDTVCNVIAVNPVLRPLPAYTSAYRGFAPLPPPYYYEFDDAQRVRRNAILREWHASDGARWSDSRNAAAGDVRRAALAAAHAESAERVLDLGCGSCALKRALPSNCAYQGLDLIQRDDTTIVADLNRALPQAIAADHVVASHILEHLHEPAAVLGWCAAFAAKLTCLHRTDSRGSGEPGVALAGLLNASGWQVVTSVHHGADMIFHCVSRR